MRKSIRIILLAAVAVLILVALIKPLSLHYYNQGIVLRYLIK